MTVYPEDEPRNIREVGIALRSLRREVNEIKTSIERTKTWVIVGIACPIIVGVFLALLFKL